jgi:uncharacterized alkaline shock family protein YloU
MSLLAGIALSESRNILEMAGALEEEISEKFLLRKICRI